jgi:glutamate transport system permease protein
VSTLVENFDVFVSGFWVTLQVCVLSAAGALILGTIVAVLRISPVPPLQWVGRTYVTLVRNCPLTIVMFFAAFALPALGSNADFLRIPGLTSVFGRLGTDLPYFRFAVIALSVYTGAFVAEALRSGVNAVPPGQAEAARALGLTFAQNLRYVVLPQAWKVRDRAARQRDHRHDQEFGAGRLLRRGRRRHRQRGRPEQRRRLPDHPGVHRHRASATWS